MTRKPPGGVDGAVRRHEETAEAFREARSGLYVSVVGIAELAALPETHLSAGDRATI